MPDRIKNIFTKIADWWKKFTSRQKALIISSVSIVAIALIILGVVATRPDKMTLVTAKDATQAQTIKDDLDGANIKYTQSQDGMTFTIDKKDEANATIILGQNGIYSNGYSGEKTDDSYPFSNVVDGSFTTTESDKQRKDNYFKQKQMENYLKTLSNVKDAQINLSVPDDDGTLAAKSEEASASVMLNLSDSMSDDQAAAIAKFVATGLGNKTTSNITIIDTDDNILFSGGDESTSGGIASSNLSAQQKKEKYIEDKVKKVLSKNGSGSDAIYDNVQVAANLDMNFDTTETKSWNYSVASGQDQGYLDSQTTESSSSTGSNGGQPGTASNNGVNSYVTTNNGNTSSESNKTTSKYLPNETYTDTKPAAGTVNTSNSTITITAYNDVIYDEDQMKSSGQLKNQTFDQFVQANSGMTAAKVNNSMLKAVSNATGIPQANITINAYNVPQFHYSTGGRTWVDWLEIILAILIFALLGFVAFRSLRGKKEEEQAEEVSVDTLLKEQQEDEQLEDIGYNEKSEARQLIEKFVDEKPEAAANLLRNWLNEDWGE